MAARFSSGLLSSSLRSSLRLCTKSPFPGSQSVCRSVVVTSTVPFRLLSCFQASRSYAHGGRKPYDLFGNGNVGDANFRKAWDNVNEEDCLWSGSEDESDNEKGQSRLKEETRKAKQIGKERSALIDADDRPPWSVWSGRDKEKTLWTGSEDDDDDDDDDDDVDDDDDDYDDDNDDDDEDDDIPTDPYPNESSDAYLDKLFEFEETTKHRTFSDVLKDEEEPVELSPGKQARKLAVENALKKLKKGPDGRYINVWEVMSDLDILIGAFENIVSGPEYAELRQGGPKRLNMQYFKDMQARMRDPNFQFSPELKLKPKSKFVSRKKWEKAESRRRKAGKR